MKLLFKWIGIAWITIMTVTSCNKDDDCTDPSNIDCENYDPCWDVEEPHSGFLMEEALLSNEGWVWAGDDSVFFNEIRYSALHQGQGITHKWYLGSEVITEPTFTRTHGTVPPSQRPTFITISHVIEYPLDNPCYQREVGRDSTSRTYYLIKYWNEFATCGRFRCAFENQTDSFDIRIGVYENDGSDVIVFQSTGSFIGVNFHNLGDSTDYFPHIARNSLLFFDGNASSRPRGFMRPTDIKGLYKMEYRLFLNDYAVYARKLD